MPVDNVCHMKVCTKIKVAVTIVKYIVSMYICTYVRTCVCGVCSDTEVTIVHFILCTVTVYNCAYSKCTIIHVEHTFLYRPVRLGGLCKTLYVHVRIRTSNLIYVHTVRINCQCFNVFTGIDHL